MRRHDCLQSPALEPVLGRTTWNRSETTGGWVCTQTPEDAVVESPVSKDPGLPEWRGDLLLPLNR